jgi:hypothetical protein
MPKIKLTIPHALGTEEAKRRINNFLADTRGRAGSRVSDLEESWNGDVETIRFRAMGFAVGGRLMVQPAALLVEVDFPLAALPLKGRVEREILSHATTLLA